MKSVIREPYAGRELGIGGFVPEVVADVREPGVARGEFAHDGERLIHSGVHGVGSIAKRVEDEMVEVAEERFGGFRDGAEVGEVSERADTEPVHGERSVLGGDGNNACAEKVEVSIKNVKFYLRDGAFCRLRLEDVGEGTAEN